MSRGIQNFQAKESLAPALSAVDAQDKSGAHFDATRAIHVSAAATYRLYFASDNDLGDKNYVSIYLNDGATYPYCIVNIKTSAGATVGDNDVTLLY